MSLRRQKRRRSDRLRLGRRYGGDDGGGDDRGRRNILKRKQIRDPRVIIIEPFGIERPPPF